MALGGTLNLHCPNTNNDSLVDWAKASNTNDKIMIDCEVQPQHSSLYGKNGSCDLSILNAAETHAGRYDCYHENESEPFEVTVLGNRLFYLSLQRIRCINNTRSRRCGDATHSATKEPIILLFLSPEGTVFHRIHSPRAIQ